MAESLAQVYTWDELIRRPTVPTAAALSCQELVSWETVAISAASKMWRGEMPAAVVRWGWSRGLSDDEHLVQGNFMTIPSLPELQALKRAFRVQAEGKRRNQSEQEELSRRVWESLFALPELGRARTVMVYVDVPGEVRTQAYLASVQRRGKQVVVPYCDRDELGLFVLASPSELSPGTLGILEPKRELRGLPARHVEASQLDLLIVPGVAFDRRGARLGRGKGYYDRLLSQVRPDASLVGVAFECQLVAELPMLSHDVFMDKVITETAIYAGKGRGSEPPCRTARADESS